MGVPALTWVSSSLTWEGIMFCYTSLFVCLPTLLDSRLRGNDGRGGNDGMGGNDGKGRE